MMRSFFGSLFLALSFPAALFLHVHAQSSSGQRINNPEGFISQSPQDISFTENLGQVHDQDYRSRPDVLFSGNVGGVVFHLKEDGVSYQLSRVDSWKENPVEGFTKRGKLKKSPGEMTIWRLDINWLNTHPGVSVAGERARGDYNNYYLENCPNGALHVQSYEGVFYQNLYPGIDLKWYSLNGQLKYDYIIAAGADYKQILSEIEGAEKIRLNEEGELIISTPLGEIAEAAPLVTQNGKTLKSKWTLRGNRAGFDIENPDPAQGLVIDPGIRIWCTYYGGGVVILVFRAPQISEATFT